MNYEEFGGNIEGFYYSKFMEKEIADKHRQEEEPEKKGVVRSHGTEEGKKLDTK